MKKIGKYNWTMIGESHWMKIGKYYWMKKIDKYQWMNKIGNYSWVMKIGKYKAHIYREAKEHSGIFLLLKRIVAGPKQLIDWCNSVLV